MSNFLKERGQSTPEEIASHRLTIDGIQAC